MASIEKDLITMRISIFVSAIAFGVLVSGSAHALYGTAPDGAAPSAVDADPAARKIKSDECYKQADLKGLHNDARRKFHRECLEGK
ncbi:MAG: phosphate starvation-inducible protein PsiF [Roseiarcus sp.]|jgi:hypothetical protein